ncbi:chloride channel protein [Thalassomonas sp. RHCl1]|uniref:chloride channel protein n=1 Tax=Thalassomonas sp. RHCl1 TaxID=2995320 RepID=UPI00248B9349|nr:chloride channel protein [Thalassomonas sp. RHCl1]
MTTSDIRSSFLFMVSAASLRKRLALPKTSWQLCLLAIIGGAVSALLVILFTLSIDLLQQFYLTKLGDYTSLSGISRLLLPIIGVCGILLFARLTGFHYLRAGIPFVLHRLKISYGIIPLKNTLNQFVGGVIALSTGFSLGKEGPAVHLGAACCGYLGSKLHLPFNSIRTLSACGVAAGIAACFNTPVAAVIFVMEVILREYKVHMFIPVMLSAIVGSMITRSFLGQAHGLDFFTHVSFGPEHYLPLILLGVLLGCLASAFNHQLVLIIKYFQRWHITTRLLVAAVITGTLGYFFPYAMGIDSSAISFTLANQDQLSVLLLLLLAKFLMTIFAIGLGVPGGIVGPILGIGAIAGTCSALMIMQLLPGDYVASDFALMGIAGFMAATLNAPLAALLAVVELSNQVELIIPAMLSIASSCLISGQFFRNRSVFLMQLDVQQLSYRKPPIESSLQKIGVAGAMKTEFSLLESPSPQSIAQALTSSDSKALLIKKPLQNSNDYYFAEFNVPNQAPSAETVVKHKMTPLSSQETLAEAYLALGEARCGAVYIYHRDPDNILGFITFEQIRRYLLEGKLRS